MPPQNKSTVPIGTVLEGKFRVSRELGRGGMAAVYEAVNIDIGKRVAVKILAAELITSRIVRERFIREARAAAAIRSPYICDVYDSGMFEERPFLVMELLEGESLYDRLSRSRRLDVATTLTVITQAARGLAKAHEQNVVHRDLKPENIFLTRDEDGQLVAKIVDFGLAKFYEPTDANVETVRLTREGALFGTPAYMSPEQAKGQGEVDHRADLWALGCIVYECLTGQTVWSIDQGVAMILAQIAGAPIPKPSTLCPELPPSFDEWFGRALDRDPDARFQNAREFAHSLAAALRPGPTTLHPSRADDGAAIDELIENLRSELPASSPRAVPAPHKRVGLDQPALASDTSATAAASAQPPKSGTGRAIGALLIASAVVLGGYATWLYVIHPPARSAAQTEQGLRSQPSASELALAETAAHYAEVNRAQERLQLGELEGSLGLLRQAIGGPGERVARSLLSHAEVAIETDPSGPCRMTALGRPRPFELVNASSSPASALGPAGPLVVWVDDHLDARSRQAFAVLLDPALRRLGEVRSITPESTSVRQAQLHGAGPNLALMYVDASGPEPGVYVRLLEPNGRIASPARRISAVRRHQISPALARADDGGFWAVWEEETESGVTDLYARALKPSLEPAAQSVRLTAFARRGKMQTAATKPAAAVAHGYLNIVFSLQRTPQRHQVMLLRMALDSPALASGLSEGQHTKDEDRAAGTMRPVSTSYGRNTEPRLACIADGCFAVWDDEKAGALAAFIDKQQGETLWRREFAATGSRPSVASSNLGAVVAYYESSRLRMAPITRDGVGKSSILTRVSGFQPYPTLTPGSAPGEWYVAWRDYEAGHLESFLLSAMCQ